MTKYNNSVLLISIIPFIVFVNHVTYLEKLVPRPFISRGFCTRTKEVTNEWMHPEMGQ